jgi:hypothetical protein
MTRRSNLLRLAMAMIAVIAALTWDAYPARAASCGGTQGTALLLGCDNNEADDLTILYGLKSATGLQVISEGTTGIQASGFEVGVYGVATFDGVYGLGDTGVYGSGGTRGVQGSGNTYGVYGQLNPTATGTTYAVYGTGGTYGVAGTGTTAGVYGTGTTGVYGLTTGTCIPRCPTGVLGKSTTSGIGVSGSSSTGIGVSAYSATGTALSVQGKAKFSRSGLLTVPAGMDHATVSGVSLTSASLVLATVQSANGDAFVKQAIPDVAGGSFTVFLDHAPTVDVPVAWFVLN